ncbi:hypothetical protein [Kitasatospora sp. NPDC050543]|uniref:hypothetical protein n=1 Tax=Kitasatospora sp. NPDC050543 TaxID=3364054 RepID=UPI0037AC9124
MGGSPVAEGPALLDRLDGAHNHGTCRLSVSSGIHVDPVRRRVGWWLLGRHAEAYEMAARWPGWEVEFWQDRSDEHVRASGGRFAPPPIDRGGALDRVREGAREHWRGRRSVEAVGPALAVIDAAWRKVTDYVAVEADRGR